MKKIILVLFTLFASLVLGQEVNKIPSNALDAQSCGEISQNNTLGGNFLQSSLHPEGCDIKSHAKTEDKTKLDKVVNQKDINDVANFINSNHCKNC